MPRNRARKVIAVLMDHVDHLQGGYASQVRLGLDAACLDRDVELRFYIGREIGVLPHSQVYDLVDPKAEDGIVLLTAGLGAVRGLEGIIEQIARYASMPLCSMGVRVPGVPSVLADNRPGILEVIEHLVRVHKKSKIAFLAGHGKNIDACARLLAYREGLAIHGLPFDDSLVVSEAFDPASGTRATQELLRRNVGFDALIAVNDAAAMGALEALHGVGLRVPRDVALTGFDDLAICRFTKPPLTTIRQPIARMASAAIRIVCDQIAQYDVPMESSFPVNLVLRNSCGCSSGFEHRPKRTRRWSQSQPKRWYDRNRQRLESLLQSKLQMSTEPGRNWVPTVLNALGRELHGKTGAFVATLEDLLTAGSERDRAYDELQSGIAILREEFLHVSDDLEGLWNAAQRALGSASMADQVLQRMELEVAYGGLIRSYERLAAAFDLSVLKQSLADELPNLVKSAYISLYVGTDCRRLEPFFCLCEGNVFVSEVGEFDAIALFPPDVPRPEGRRIWFVLPLTHEAENLGIAVVEMHSGIGIHDMLRTQISSALKSAALHREIVTRTAQHERSVQERLDAAKRMSSLGVLAGGVAHDLNNTLGPLVALPDIMLQELDGLGLQTLGDALRCDIQTIKTASLRAAQTIKDLLALGRQGHTQRVALDLNRLVNDCLVADPLFRERATRQQVQIVADISEQPLMIAVSPAQLERALTNLLSNALEAIDGAGTIIIKTRQVCLAEPLAKYEMIDAGEYATLSIEDTGRGISEADLSRVFEPFFTKKTLSDTSGSGLGLAIVHGVTKEHDGFVDIDSDPGRGTCFTLYIPLTQEVVTPARLPSVAPTGCSRVLVVDDDPLQLRTAQRVLLRLGYEVTLAQSALDALEQCPDPCTKPRFDIALVDMLLGEGQDGLEVFEQLKCRAPQLQGILVSGHAPTERVQLAVQRGLCFLQKPYTASELGKVVQSLLTTRDSQLESP